LPFVVNSPLLGFAGAVGLCWPAWGGAMAKPVMLPNVILEGSAFEFGGTGAARFVNLTLASRL
jgi:hypothetical protein